MNKIALVTGAANRIGAAIAKKLAADGYAVAVHFNRSEKDANEVCKEITKNGGKAIAIRADLYMSEQRNRLIAKVVKSLGSPNVLINNASVYEPDSATTIDEDIWNRHFEIHAKAPMFLIRDFAAQLPGNTKGNVINMIDERVLRIDPGYFSYNLSKSVLWTATKTLAQSLAPHVRVNAIGPGPTLPHDRQSQVQFENSIEKLPLKTSATPEQIARAIIFLLDNPSITGQMLALDGGEHLEWRGRAKITPSQK